jgi:hypothetical protein
MARLAFSKHQSSAAASPPLTGAATGARCEVAVSRAWATPWSEDWAAAASAGGCRLAGATGAGTALGVACGAGWGARVAISGPDDWRSCATAAGADAGGELQCEARKRPPAIRLTPIPTIYHSLSFARIVGHIRSLPGESILSMPEGSIRTQSNTVRRMRTSNCRALIEINVRSWPARPAQLRSALCQRARDDVVNVG